MLVLTRVVSFALRCSSARGQRWPLAFGANKRTAKRYSSGGFLCRKPLIEARCFFDWRRRSRAPAVGLVGRRGAGATAARRIKSSSRSRASARLRSWVRWRCALIISTPSRVRRRPASRSSRARTSSGSRGERRTSKRNCTALASLLTFCPPGPEARMKCSSTSSSPMLIDGVMRIIAGRGPQQANSLARFGSPTGGRLAGLGEMASSAGALARADPMRAADHGHEEAAAEQPFRHPLGVRERDGIDETGAALHIVDAEIVELHLHELAGDAVRRVEPERKGTFEISFGLDELGFRRPVLGEPVDLAFDDLDRLRGRVSPRRGMAEQQRAAIEPEEAVGDAV